jgi:hypothetical protein
VGYSFGLLCILLLGINIGGCTIAERAAEADSASKKVDECLARESQVVALMPVDPETATQAVFGRCSAELSAERKAWSAWHPGNRPQEAMENEVHKLTAWRLDETRKTIAAIRKQ